MCGFTGTNKHKGAHIRHIRGAVGVYIQHKCQGETARHQAVSISYQYPISSMSSLVVAVRVR